MFFTSAYEWEFWTGLTTLDEQIQDEASSYRAHQVFVSPFLFQLASPSVNNLFLEKSVSQASEFYFCFQLLLMNPSEVQVNFRGIPWN